MAPVDNPPPAASAVVATAAAAHPSFNEMFVFGCIIICLAIFFVSPFVVYAVLRPDLPEFSVASAAVSNLTIGPPSGLLTAVIDLTLSIDNPNGQVPSAFDGPLKASVFGPAGATLAQAAFPPPRRVESRRSAVVEARFWIVSQYVGEGAARGIAEEIGRSAEVQARVAAVVKVNLDWALGSSDFSQVMVCCDGVRLRRSDPAVAAGGPAPAPAHCEVSFCFYAWRTGDCCDCSNVWDL